MTSRETDAGTPWGPPTPVDAHHAADRVEQSPKPRRTGWVLLLAGVAAIGLTVVLGWQRVVGPLERFTAPGAATVECRAGDAWRVGPRTSTSRSVGSITVTTATDPAGVRIVVVGSDGAELATSPVEHIETFRLGDAEYRAVLAFECAADGPTTVSVTSDAPVDVAVFPSFGRVMRSVLRIAPIGLAGLAGCVVGMVLVITRRPRSTS